MADRRMCLERSTIQGSFLTLAHRATWLIAELDSRTGGLRSDEPWAGDATSPEAFAAATESGTTTRHWWGDLYELYLDELNGARDYDKITALLKRNRAMKR